MCKSMKLLAALILSACLASPALAQHERHWRHDGAEPDVTVGDVG